MAVGDFIAPIPQRTRTWHRHNTCTEFPMPLLLASITGDMLRAASELAALEQRITADSGQRARGI